MISKYFLKRNANIELILKSLKPNSKIDYLVFIFFLILYFSIGVYIALTTNIIDKKDTYDMYFSFDNTYSLYIGTSEQMTHPFTKQFYTPLIYVYKIIKKIGFDDKIFTILVLFFCAFFISSTVYIINKYLENIIKLNNKISLLISIFYGFFSGCLVLSFTPDSFTFSLFLLTLNIYIVSFLISNGKIPSYFYYLFSAFFISGQTITNAPKAVFPILFEKNKINFKSFLKLSMISFTIFFITIARFRFNISNFILSNIERAKSFTHNKISLFDSFFSYFFGGNILLPSLRIDNSEWKHITNKGIYLNFYDHYFQYSISIIILLVIIISVIKNFKNRLFLILTSCFAVDLFYLFVLKIGTNESFIHGGHFIYLIPLFIGWLYTSLSEKLKIILSSILLVCLIVIVINNLIRIYEFIDLAKIIYPL